MSVTIDGMRKSLGLLVVSLLALTGCAAPTVAESAPSSALTTASPSAENKAPKAKPSPVNPDKAVEEQFVRFAETRAWAHSISDEPSAKEVITGLHSYCEDGKAFKVSKSTDYNKNLATSAESSFCEMLTE